MIRPTCMTLVFGLTIARSALPGEPTNICIGSKAFTESVVPAEIVVHLGENERLTVEHVKDLKGTRTVGATLRRDIGCPSGTYAAWNMRWPTRRSTRE